MIAEVCYLLSERAGAAAEVGLLRSFVTGELELAESILPDVRRMADCPSSTPASDSYGQARGCLHASTGLTGISDRGT